MISINLSIDQLIDVIRNLSEADKKQVRNALDSDTLQLSKEQEDILLQRKKAYEAGNVQSFSVNEVKSALNYKR